MTRRLLWLLPILCSMAWGQGTTILPNTTVLPKTTVISPAAGVTAVTFDVAGAGATNASGTTITASHTVTNALANSAVVAVIHWEQSSGTPLTGCTYNGSSMTQMWNFLETNANIMGSAGFVFANGTGDGTAHNVVCTGPASWQASGAAIETLSFGHVNQSTPAHTAFTQSASGTATLAVSNAVNGDMGVDGITDLSSTAVATTTSGGTQQATHTNILGSGFSAATSTVPATGSVTMTYTVHGTVQAYGAAALAHQ